MEVQELKDKLDGFQPFIVVHGKEIDKSNEKVKEFIELYYQLTGKRVGDGTCRNCIFDAYMELSIKTKEQLKRLIMPCKFKMKEGRVVIFNNTDYTNANMTDEIAMQMVAFNVKHAGNFLDPEAVLKAFAESKTSKPKKEVKEIEKEPTISKTETVQQEELLTLDDLKAKYQEVKGKKPHWKWDYDTIVAKLNED